MGCISLETGAPAPDQKDVVVVRIDGGPPVAANDDHEPLLAFGDCRMCFEGQTSHGNPIIPLGCRCLGENSYAHVSCIRQWFAVRWKDGGRLRCEICKSSLGAQAKEKVMDLFRPRMFQTLLRRRLLQFVEIVFIILSVFIRILGPIIRMISFVFIRILGPFFPQLQSHGNDVGESPEPVPVADSPV